MIKGMSIVLYERMEGEKDSFNRPIEQYNKVIVDDVLVGEPSSDDVISQHSLTGKKAVYTIAIPKGDTHKWENAIVEFFGRKWHVFTIPIQGIEDNIPLRWNKKVMVETYE